MGKTKHEKSFVDFDKGYEQNIIGLRGVIYFALGLFFLIVITFGLMWALQNVMDDQFESSIKSNNPLLLSEKERLPPEPRLQAAPGFGVDSEKGRVNLELKAPQSEWWEIQEQYKATWKNGQKDPTTGKIVTLSVDAAKEKYLQSVQNAGASDETYKKSKMHITDSSAGRIASEIRR